MTINEFRGQVKVADVSAAFDEIVNRINGMVEKYNTTLDLEDIDYTKGSPKLGAVGYTLTVGGLKSLLNSYNDSTIGCKAYKVDSKHVLVSSGFHIKDGVVHRVDAQVVGNVTSPSVRPEASEAYYAYTSSAFNYNVYINSVTEHPVEGSTYNHLSNVPFEFNKVYRIVDQIDINNALLREYKFGDYNYNLDKIVPIASCGKNAATIYEIPLGSDGNPETGSTAISEVDQSSIGTIPAIPDYDVGNYAYIQKVEVDGQIKLYISAYYGIHYLSGIITDDPNDETNAFTELMSRCNYIINTTVDSNTNVISSVPYYEISGTLDEITDVSQLGEAHYYSDTRPSSGGAVDVSQMYLDTDGDELHFKAWKSGTGDATITTTETTYVQPDITSNTSHGTFTATSNSDDAYKVTNSGWMCNTMQSGDGSITWNFKNPIKLSNVTFAYDARNVFGEVNLYVDGTLLDTQQVEGTEGSTVSVDLDNVISREVKIVISRPFSSKESESEILFSGLTLTGTIDVYAINEGETTTPMPSIVKLYNLNWLWSDVILNGVENAQLEGIEGYSITSQSRKIEPKGYGSWETLGNSKEGKFVAYTTSFHNYNRSMSGTTTFMGLTLNGQGVHSNTPDRQHYRAQALSLIYIPRGFTPTDFRTGKGARWVYKAKLNK